jgi:hypothetical protein
LDELLWYLGLLLEYGKAAGAGLAGTYLGVHLIVREQAQIFEDLVAQVMSLIDDQNWALLGLQGQARDITRG